MKVDPALFAQVVDAIAHEAQGDQYREITESVAVRVIGGILPAGTDVLELWEAISSDLRRPVVRGGHVVEFNMFRGAVRVTKLPNAEELERIAELYRLSAPEEIERRIRLLSGIQFERFVSELLGKLPVFRNVVVTQISRDGGVDFRGVYIPDASGLEWPLVGQAKQVGNAIGAGDARDFIGALDTAGERSPVGLFVSTSGFTEPALEVFERSRYRVMRWGMDEIRHRMTAAEMGLRKLDLSLHMLDETFWDEVVGGPKAS
jgi:restriction endonuclease Mrr